MYGMEVMLSCTHLYMCVRYGGTVLMYTYVHVYTYGMKVMLSHYCECVFGNLRRSCTPLYMSHYVYGMEVMIPCTPLYMRVQYGGHVHLCTTVYGMEACFHRWGDRHIRQMDAMVLCRIKSNIGSILFSDNFNYFSEHKIGLSWGAW